MGLPAVRPPLGLQGLGQEVTHLRLRGYVKRGLVAGDELSPGCGRRTRGLQTWSTWQCPRTQNRCWGRGEKRVGITEIR